MEFKIVLNNDSQDVVGFVKMRRNATNKTIINKIKEYISKEYKCEVRRMLQTGTINYYTGINDISYVLFGENLPFRNIRIYEM